MALRAAVSRVKTVEALPNRVLSACGLVAAAYADQDAPGPRQGD